MLDDDLTEEEKQEMRVKICKIQPGTRVIYRGGDEPEEGVVVKTWYNSEIQEVDCRIVFYDGVRDDGEPYTLRYAASSLEAVRPDRGVVFDGEGRHNKPRIYLVWAYYRDGGIDLRAVDSERWMAERHKAQVEGFASGRRRLKFCRIEERELNHSYGAGCMERI